MNKKIKNKAEHFQGEMEFSLAGGGTDAGRAEDIEDTEGCLQEWTDCGTNSLLRLS